MLRREGERTLRAACTERLTAKGFTQLSSACSANLAKVTRTKGIRKSDIHAHSTRNTDLNYATNDDAKFCSSCS